MYFVEMHLDYGIAFISGLNQGFENALLTDFQSWLVKECFDEPQAFAWEVLIRKIPDCSTDDDAFNIQTFLNLLDRYIVLIESSQRTL